MFGEKEGSKSSSKKFQGIETVYMLQILGTSAKILGNLQAGLEIR